MQNKEVNAKAGVCKWAASVIDCWLSFDNKQFVVFLSLVL